MQRLYRQALLLFHCFNILHKRLCDSRNMIRPWKSIHNQASYPGKLMTQLPTYIMPDSKYRVGRGPMKGDFLINIPLVLIGCNVNCNIKCSKNFIYTFTRRITSFQTRIPSIFSSEIQNKLGILNILQETSDKKFLGNIRIL